MVNFYKILFPFCFLLILNSTQAQKSSISQYTDDGGLSEIRNYIAFDAMQLFIGDLGLQYGHQFTKHLALEGGVGILLPYYWGSFLDPIEDSDFWGDNDDNITKYGFSLFARGKVLMSKQKIKSPYADLTLLMRHYGADHRYYATIGFGYQLVALERILFSFGFDAGGVYRASRDVLASDSHFIIEKKEAQFNFSLGLSFRFGYCF